jgi:hypothetical protein
MAAPIPIATDAKNFSKLAGSMRRVITPSRIPFSPFNRWAMTLLSLRPRWLRTASASTGSDCGLDAKVLK